MAYILQESSNFSGGDSPIQGSGGLTEQAAARIADTSKRSYILNRVIVRLKVTASPTDNILCSIYRQDDQTLSNPQGATLVATAIASINGANLTTSYQDSTYDFSGDNVIVPTVDGVNYAYYIVLSRDGARDATNYFNSQIQVGGFGTSFKLDNGTWGFNFNGMYYQTYSDLGNTPGNKYRNIKVGNGMGRSENAT